MKVVILAAGEGTRLRPITLETPKPLIDIGGKPIIKHLIASLPDEIDTVVMVVEHLKEKIVVHLGNNFLGRKIVYVDQDKAKKGTFGALFSARNLIEEGERFLVLNGDDLHDPQELEECIKYPRSLGVQRMVMPRYYNIVVDSSGFVTSFRPQNADDKEILVATGAYVLDSNIFKHPGVQVGGNEYGLPQSVLAQINEHPIKAVITDKWIPINSIADVETANRNFQKL